MTEAVLAVAVTIFAIIGLSDVINWVVYKLLCPAPPRQVLLLPLEGRDTEISLYAALAGAHPGKAARILAVDFGLDAKAAERARAYCREHPRLEYCKAEALLDVIAVLL